MASRLRFGSSLGALHAVAPIVGATGYVREERWLAPPGAGGGGAGTEVQCGAGAQTSGAGARCPPPPFKGCGRVWRRELNLAIPFPQRAEGHVT